MAKPRAKKIGGLGHGDRVRRRDGLSGTVIDVHEGARVSVLPDLGRSVQQMWWREDLERTGGPARKCYRCSAAGHTAVSCRGASRS